MESKHKKELQSSIIVIILAIGVALWIGLSFLRPYSGEAKRIFIPRGSDEEAIADTLKSNFGELGGKINWIWRLQKGNPKNAEGSYVIKEGMRPLDISRLLKYGRQTPMRVAINNARTMEEWAQKACKTLEIEPQDFLQACDSLMPLKGYTEDTRAASMVPDTYEFYWNARAPQVVERLVQYRDKFWNADRTAKAEALGLTAVQVSTLASIVEEETAKADEMPRVARLYLNRLDRGMPLQADPTVKFAVGNFGLRRILAKHLAVESPYNTYKNAGLPPGPIRIASQQAIDAVLNASNHDCLYMCAKEDFSGYHNFAKTLDEHQANARRYHAELNRRGIK